MGLGDTAALSILFVLTLAATSIAATFVAYAAHCVMVVVQGTAAERDEITWPSELMTDWLREAMTLVALVAIWLVPAGLLSRGLSDSWLVGQPALPPPSCWPCRGCG